MKQILLTLVAVLPALSFGSSHVCSGERIYFSNIRKDFGTQPPKGMVTGSLVVALDGDVLLKYTKIQGLFPQGVPPYQLALEGTGEVLSEKGNQVSGEKVYEQIGVLYQVKPMNPADKTELARETVVCRDTWAMVP